MCGICGYAGFEPDEKMLSRMTNVIKHRGPDDKGFYLDNNVGLGMRRLSIIDVYRGKQPIVNENEDVVIVFNGEIYNYKDLTKKLLQKGHKFTSKSDTETILHLYEEYDTDCVLHLRGIFAFAIYDKCKKRLFVSRDRLGVKPLYYWTQNNKLVFSSEIKSVMECGEVTREPNLASINNFLTLRYVPGPETMIMNVFKLLAGHQMLWENDQLRIERYWQPKIDNGPYKSDNYYQVKFEELLSESVKMRLMSDVPLGAYLSGGLDSSAIVALMSEMCDKPVKTFSVGFDWQMDELPAARLVANRLGCEHREIICGPNDFEQLHKIIWNLDEPIGDAIVVPMFLLSRLASEHVSVVLSGEGADEILAGYFFHKVMSWARRYVHSVPQVIRNGIVCPLMEKAPASLLNLVFDYPGTLGNRGHRKILDYLKMVGRKDAYAEYHFLISLFDKMDKSELYNARMSKYLNKELANRNDEAENAGSPYLDNVLRLQYEHWLPDDILMKQDKMSMANSVEARVPFLDHVLVEFLLKTPPHLKLCGLKNKILLRNCVAKLFPGNLSRQKKKAFYIPVDKYLTEGPLREMVEICLSEKSVRERGYFNWKEVQRLRQLTSERDFLYGKQLFALLVLELWHRIFIDRESGW